MYLIGEINEMKVLRKTDIGYLLLWKEEEVFLHSNQADDKTLEPDMIVQAFIYYDHKNRITATLETPIITISTPGFISVIDVVPHLGVFMNNGISKGLLLSKDGLPNDFASWPQLGEELYCVLKVKNNLVAKVASKEEIDLLPETALVVNDDVSGIVYRLGAAGINLMTKLGHKIYVHQTNYRRDYHVGEVAQVKIIHVIDERLHEYNGSLVPQKENLMDLDAKTIYDYLLLHKTMSLTSESDPKEIFETFKISKRAFKRAIGGLYKDRVIDFIDGQTVLAGSDKNE